MRPHQNAPTYGIVVLALFIPYAALASSVCEYGVNYPGGDLPEMPLAVRNASECGRRCADDDRCNLYTFRQASCTYAGDSGCSKENNHGCCYLKSEIIQTISPKVNNCTCSSLVRVPRDASFRPKGSYRMARNILYILVDDLRPELEAYAHEISADRVLHSPNIQKLADSGTVFDNAYCQISVCSPSRLSFLTSRRPDHAGTYNFINHFRQADCGLNVGGRRWQENDDLRRTSTFEIDGAKDCEWGGQLTVRRERHVLYAVHGARMRSMGVERVRQHVLPICRKHFSK
mgnify:CR=1 FL=1